MRLLLLFLLPMSFAATYYVSTSGCSDTYDGAIDRPWCSIQHAADSVSAGDTVYVRQGNYDERVNIRKSGSAGKHMIFAGYWEDDKPVMRGFNTGRNDYIKIVGFEITHKDGDSHGIDATGSDHIEILNNYIHHTDGHGIRAASWSGYHSSHITVRGNEIFMGACPSGGDCNGNGYGMQGNDCSYMLFEYNHLHRVADFVDYHGDHVIVRNNYMHDFANSYWPQGPGDALHADMFQPAGSPQAATQYHVYESNMMGDNIESNSHILQMRSESGLDDHHVIFRGNVGYNHGSYAMQCAGVDNVYYYSNTIDEMNTRVTWGASALRYNNEGGSNPTIGNINFNNIFTDIGKGPALNIEPGNACQASDNLCHDTGGHSSCKVLLDPLYTDKQERDYHLMLQSPARGMGREITQTTGSGTGTEVTVDKGDLLMDGYGLAEGDLISIGGDKTRIAGIAGNMITLSSPVTWQAGEPVYWRTASMDIGAFPYRESYDISCSASYTSGRITAETEPSLVRYVEFIIDGIPVALDFDPPYELEWEGASKVEAIARPLFADKVLGYPCEMGCMHAADRDCDGSISLTELKGFIGGWILGRNSMSELMSAIAAWKS